MKLSRQAFTLIELLVVLSILAVLVGLVFPVFGKVQSQARTVKCASSLRQLGTAALLYASEHEMTLPVSSHQGSGQSWTLTLKEYANGKVVFRCPNDEHKTRSYTYVLNDFLTPNPAGVGDPAFDYSRISRISSPRETLLMTEASKTYTSSDHFHFSFYYGTPLPPEIFASQVAVERHGGSANYVFADGHLETLTWAEAQSFLNKTNTRFLDPSNNL